MFDDFAEVGKIVDAGIPKNVQYNVGKGGRDVCRQLIEGEERDNNT